MGEAATTPSPAFFQRYGISRTGDPAHPLEIAPYPHVCRHGLLRATVIASAIDIAGSLNARSAAGADPTTTIDLSLRVPARELPQRITTTSEILRSGRSLVTTGLRFEADGATFAYGQTSFMRVAARDPQAPPPPGMPEVIEPVPLERPLVDEVGIETVDASRGHIELVLRERLMNGSGTMQGALVALLCESAAEVLAEHTHGGAQTVCELDLRYLAAARVGPVASQAQWVGDAASGMMQVELRDLGNEGRLTGAALLRTRAVG